jgi:hypothetical protein
MHERASPCRQVRLTTGGGCPNVHASLIKFAKAIWQFRSQQAKAARLRSAAKPCQDVTKTFQVVAKPNQDAAKPCQDWYDDIEQLWESLR